MPKVPAVHWQVIERKVDWFTATISDVRQVERFVELGRDIVQSEQLDGTTGTGKSFEGYSGIAAGGAFVGERDEGAIISLRSATAGSRWIDVLEMGGRCSRIDVCVTGQADCDVPSLAYAVRYGPRLPGRRGGRPSERTFYSKEHSGDTCYVGSAGNDRRGRVYDKTRESEGAYPVGCWRWEVQYRHGPADALARTLGTGDTLNARLASVVSTWWADQGLPLPFDTGLDGVRDAYIKEETSDERRMKWLAAAIRPMLSKMRGRYTVRQLRAVLGLQYNTDEDPHELWVYHR